MTLLVSPHELVWLRSHHTLDGNSNSARCKHATTLAQPLSPLPSFANLILLPSCKGGEERNLKHWIQIKSRGGLVFAYGVSTLLWQRSTCEKVCCCASLWLQHLLDRRAACSSHLVVAERTKFQVTS